MDEKREFRNIYRTRRNGMSHSELVPLSEQICANLTGSDLFCCADSIYAYYPLGNEADVRPVAKTAWLQGKRVAFPKVFGDEMRYFEVEDFGQLAEGSFGVMEPEQECGAAPVDWVGECALLVLVPGVAFDRNGNRMGFGKGYYDRHFKDSADIPGMTLVGVAYGMQIADLLPTEEHDLAVPYIVTEEGIIAAAD